MATENAADYTKTANLATVATSGSYNDLLNKPEIPDVSDYYTKSEVDEGFVSSTFNVAEAGKLLKIDTDGSVITAEVAGSTVDNAMSTTSTNPVQNKVITDEIKNITSYKIGDFIPGYYCNNTVGASGNTTE